MTLDTANATAKMKKCPTPPGAQCLICFEDSVATGDTLLQTNDDCCSHFVCRACLRFYLIHCENDRKKIVKCPDPECSAAIANAVMESVLGRAYAPKVWHAHQNDHHHQQQQQQQQQHPPYQVDAELQAWLSANDAKKCKNCFAWIVREDGCDAMQCLCGWRFCYECEMPIRAGKNVFEIHDNDDDDDDEEETRKQCRCGWELSDFYDNILGSEGRDTAPRLATLEDLNDLKTFYERRQDEDCSSYASYDRSEVEYYAMEEEEEEECTFHEEPAPSVFVGTILDWEEPAFGGLTLVPLWLDLMDQEEEEEEEGGKETAATTSDQEEAVVEEKIAEEGCSLVPDLMAKEAERKANGTGDTDEVATTPVEVHAQDMGTKTGADNDDDAFLSVTSMSSKTSATPLLDQQPGSDNGVVLDVAEASSATPKSSQVWCCYPLVVIAAPILWLVSKRWKS